MVGLIPFFAVHVLERKWLEHLPKLQARVDSYLRERPHIDFPHDRRSRDRNDRAILAIPSREQLVRVLTHLLDETSLLAPTGIRSLSKRHHLEPFVLHAPSGDYRADYAPDDSRTKAFGINSNWRGPVWFPLNYLLVEALYRYHDFYGDTLRVECPTGSGVLMNLKEAAIEIERRLASTFLADRDGRSARAMATIRGIRTIPTSRISFCSTSISRATPAGASAPLIRPAGRHSRYDASRTWRKEGRKHLHDNPGFRMAGDRWSRRFRLAHFPGNEDTALPRAAPRLQEAPDRPTRPREWRGRRGGHRRRTPGPHVADLQAHARRRHADRPPRRMAGERSLRRFSLADVDVRPRLERTIEHAVMIPARAAPGDSLLASGLAGARVARDAHAFARSFPAATTTPFTTRTRTSSSSPRWTRRGGRLMFQPYASETDGGGLVERRLRGTGILVSRLPLHRGPRARPRLRRGPRRAGNVHVRPRPGRGLPGLRNRGRDCRAFPARPSSSASPRCGRPSVRAGWRIPLPWFARPRPTWSNATRARRSSRAIPGSRTGVATPSSRSAACASPPGG